ncbi:MAG TPA: alpha/beta hydrolase [Streptosporangiaceae bacterium]|nr:alpha/beta hydrolase [Streptosporangiaceae bacterium]
MGLIMEHNGPAEGYEAVPLLIPGAAGDTEGNGVAVLRRRSARRSKRAVLYVHCLGDAFVPADLARWYTDRGFHFYAADLRAIGSDEPAAADGNRAAAELAECFACLDAAATHLRAADAIETLVVSAHAAGALISALWCHARRGSRPVDALILASPDLGGGWPWLARVAGREDSPAGRPPALLAGARRRLRQGLQIPCPVLVMCPAGEASQTGGGSALARGGLAALGALGTLTGRRATTRLGEHVTWLTMDGGLPGQATAGPAAGQRYLDEIGRWLGAYLSAQIRDQLL